MSSLESRLDLFRPPGGSPGARLREAVFRALNPGGVVRTLAPFLAVGGCALALTGFSAVAVSRLHDTLERSRIEGERLRGQTALLEIQLDRLRAVQGYSAEYDIPADLAAEIYDIALAERLEPDLAFRLVETESSFRERAVSEAGAIGLAQVKPSTAAWLDPSVGVADLFERRTNLRLGFRYLDLLLRHYDGDMRLALLAYNRGPARVEAILASGGDPANGYALRVLDAEQP